MGLGLCGDVGVLVVLDGLSGWSLGRRSLEWMGMRGRGGTGE